MKKLRKTEVNLTALKSAVISLCKNFKDSDDVNSVKTTTQFNHSEAMKLLELNENELNMFINTADDQESGIIQKLDAENIDCDTVTKMLIEKVEKYIDSKVEFQGRKSQAE